MDRIDVNIGLAAIAQNVPGSILDTVVHGKPMPVSDLYGHDCRSAACVLRMKEQVLVI